MLITILLQFRSNYIKFFSARFLAEPISLFQYEGLAVKDNGHYHSVFTLMHLNRVKNLICHNQHCPSIQIKDKKRKD